MSRPIGKLLPRHTDSMLASVLILISILLVVVAIGTPTASAKTLCTQSNRAGGNSTAAVLLCPAECPQAPDLQWGKPSGRYNDASGCTLAAEGTAGETAATGFRGSEGFGLKNAPYQPVRNAAGEANGQPHSGRALEQMQNRGIMPSAVQNAIQTGPRFATRAGTAGYYDAVNNVRVIANSLTGRVVTVIRGAP